MVRKKMTQRYHVNSE